MKRILATLFTLLCAYAMTLGNIVAQAQTTDNDSKVHSQVVRIGTGDKAKATAKLKNGTEIKGNITEANADSFTIREKDTGTATTLAYADVKEVKSRKSNRTLFITLAAVGAAVVVGLVALRTFGCDGGAASGGICGN